MRIQLADCPRDVLLWLSETCPGGVSKDDIVAAMEPLAPDLSQQEVQVRVSSALRLLAEMDLVRLYKGRGQRAWCLTADGAALVEGAAHA